MKVRQVTDSTINVKKIKLLESLAISGNYNLAADSLPFSYLSLSGRTTLFEKISITGNMTFDPYVTNEKQQRINQFYYNENHKLVRTVNSGLSVSWSLHSKKTDYKSDKASPQELKELNSDPTSFIDFSIPYNISVGYNLNHTNGAFTADQTIQTVNFNGDLLLTPKWKITFS